MKHKVLIMRCDEYDADRIAGIIKEGMEELEVKPSGRILLKPNVVIAHPDIFPYAFTRKEFLDGAIEATKVKAEKVEEISVGERSGITIPTRYNFKNAGYPEVIKKHKIKTYYFDEDPHVPVKIKAKGRLRDTLFIPKPIVKTDFLINLPKFKAHPWCRLTLSLKNFIGIQDDRHRLVDHNLFLEHKIADLQEVIQPKFIAIDGITAGQKMMLTPTPFHLGAIVMGTNSCAVDTVGCHMVRVEPDDLIHLKYTSQRGFGPMDIEEIEVKGDFPLEEVRHKTKNFEFCLERIDEYFKPDSHLSCTVGTFPEKHSSDYCWGGCPGALQEAMHIFRGFYPNVEKEMQKVRYVVGKVKEPLELEEGEKVIFAGSCTSYKGKINGKDVNIKSSYKNYREVDEHKTKSNDMFLKVIKNLWQAFFSRSSGYLQAKGCTLSVAEHVNYLSAMGKIKNPNFDPRLLIPVNIAYFQMRIMRFLNRIIR
ncbi:MAG: DUF362 domain-containing protein [Thermodesulfobacteriota bacterium]|nr:DUF362 domain-containing protein [Thermodesulfobacteriota bacterium]